MLAFFKSMPILSWLFAAAIAAAAWLVLDLTLTKAALEDAREEKVKWERAAVVLDRINEREEPVIRAAQSAERLILEAPSADTLVPQDVADAWAAGFDSVRDAANSDRKHDVQRSADRAPK